MSTSEALRTTSFIAKYFSVSFFRSKDDLQARRETPKRAKTPALSLYAILYANV